MGYDPQRHHRRSIRLRGYDYTQAGAYFVTICIQHRLCLLGDILDGAVRLNEAGCMVHAVWNEIPDHYPGVDVDAFVVMPNHVHGIIVLTGRDEPVGVGPRAYPFDAESTGDGQPRGVAPTQGDAPTQGVAPTQDVAPTQGDAPTQDIAPTQGDAPTRLSLPDAVHRFKSFTTARYGHGVKQYGWPPFPGRLWQRNYYEHIIRDENDLRRIRQYIINNPGKWDLDRVNPARPQRSNR